MLDCGLRATLVANQTAVINAAPDARNRATTIFASHMWGGNAAGAAIASVAYAQWGWYAVCGIGVIAASTALIVARTTNRK
jgi:predicted MFS family arabinose efflux permease